MKLLFPLICLHAAFAANASKDAQPLPKTTTSSSSLPLDLLKTLEDPKILPCAMSKALMLYRDNFLDEELWKSSSYAVRLDIGSMNPAYSSSELKKLASNVYAGVNHHWAKQSPAYFQTAFLQLESILIHQLSYLNNPVMNTEEIQKDTLSIIQIRKDMLDKFSLESSLSAISQLPSCSSAVRECFSSSFKNEN